MNFNLQRRKQRQNSLPFAPFHTTGCSMADVKCIYAAGTFPDTSWSLGKIAAICLRETGVARLETRVFIFTTHFRLPSTIPWCQRKTLEILLCHKRPSLLCTLCLCSLLYHGKKQSLFLPIGSRLFAAMQICSCAYAAPAAGWCMC